MDSRMRAIILTLVISCVAGLVPHVNDSARLIAFQVIVSDKYYNGVLTFSLPEMFTAIPDRRTRAAVDIHPWNP